MALAARCPHCRSLFRVVADQLKLRGGLVRCGECRKVFDAIGSLTYVDDDAVVRPAAEAPLAGTAHPGPQFTTPPAAPPAPAPQPPRQMPRPSVESAPRPAVPPSPEADAELGVPTLFGPSQETVNAVPGEPSAQEPVAELEAQQSADGEDMAPHFLTSLERQRAHWFYGAACVPLVLLALAQGVLALREQTLEILPSLRPLAVKACALYGCSAEWPAHPELLTIVGSELTSVPGTDVIELNASIRSRAGFIMALPAIEVTLTDSQNRTVARKVFLPVDYLASSGEPSSRLDEGLAPDSDLSVRLIFEAQGLSVTGFVIYPFYV